MAGLTTADRQLLRETAASCALLLAQVASIAKAIDVLAGARTAAPRRAPDISRPLNKVAAAIGDRTCTTPELCMFANMQPDDVLRSALVEIAGAVNPRKIGNAFRLYEGANLGGVTIVRVGEVRDGILWHLHVTPRLKPANAIAPATDPAHRDR